MSKRSAAERVLNGETWTDFCDALKHAGEVVLRDSTPMDPFERAEGFRYLSRLTRVALESFVEFADPEFPVLRRPSHETVKIGADNPDNHYESAAIRGAYDYRIRGTRGTIHYLGFGTYAGGYGEDGRRGQDGYIEAKNLAVAPDGRFEIVVSAREHPGNWLPMQPDSSLLIVRQTYRDRDEEEIAKLSIERIGTKAGPAPLTAEFLDTGLARAAAYVDGTAALFTDWSEGFAQRKNELPKFDSEVAAAAHGDPNICYFHGYWELGPDQALVIEVTPPKCAYWNFQVNNHWMESLDYRYHRIAVNHHGACLRDDGSVRLILAHRDPGVDNWLDTAHHCRGTMCLRWIGADEHPEPTTQVVSFSEL